MWETQKESHRSWKSQTNGRRGTRLATLRQKRRFESVHQDQGSSALLQRSRPAGELDYCVFGWVLRPDSDYSSVGNFPKRNLRQGVWIHTEPKAGNLYGTPSLRKERIRDCIGAQVQQWHHALYEHFQEFDALLAFLRRFQHVLFPSSPVHCSNVGIWNFLHWEHRFILHFWVFEPPVSFSVEKPSQARHDWTWHSKGLGLFSCELCKLFLGSDGVAYICRSVLSLRRILLFGCFVLPDAAVGLVKAQPLQERLP